MRVEPVELTLETSTSAAGRDGDRRVWAHPRGGWKQGRPASSTRLACLLGQAPPGGYAEIARRLDSTEGAVKVSVHRLRRRFQAQLKHDIAETVADSADVDDEIRYLLRALDA